MEVEVDFSTPLAFGVMQSVIHLRLDMIGIGGVCVWVYIW